MGATKYLIDCVLFFVFFSILRYTLFTAAVQWPDGFNDFSIISSIPFLLIVLGDWLLALILNYVHFSAVNCIYTVLEPCIYHLLAQLLKQPKSFESWMVFPLIVLLPLISVLYRPEALLVKCPSVFYLGPHPVNSFTKLNLPRHRDIISK